ncbi:MAG: ABC transporter transmembrane domain-containing protein, partial [Acholeplasmataceae bacterium]
MSQPQQKSKDKPTRPMRGGFRGMGYFEKAQDFKGTMKKLYQYIKPYLGKIYFSGFMSVLASLVTVLAPWLLGLMISEVAIAFQNGRELLPIHIIFGFELELLNMSILVILLYILAGMLSYFQAYLLIGMTQDVTYQMRQEIALKLNRLPLSYFDSQSFGDVLGRSTNDVETISQTLNQSLSEVFRAVTLLLGV